MDSLTVILISSGVTLICALITFFSTIHVARKRFKVDSFDSLVNASSMLRKEMREELESARKEMSVLREKIAEYQEEIFDLKAKIEKYEIEILAYQSNLRLSEEKIETLRGQIGLLEQELSKYKEMT